MKLYLFFIFAFLVCSISVIAVPQVIFSSFNMTIITNCTSTSYHFFSDGGEVIDSYPVAFSISGLNASNATISCSGNYTKLNVPLTFSREIQQNNTDMAVLIHSLAVNNNVTKYWSDCQQNLTSCMSNYGYRENWTTCQINYAYLSEQNTNSVKELSLKQKDIDSLQNQRLILIVVALAGLGFGYYSYRKNTPKTVNSPMSKMPSVLKVS